MDARYFENVILNVDKEKELRKLILDEKWASAEQLASMSLKEVCEVAAKKYDILYLYEGPSSEKVMLVKKDDITNIRPYFKTIWGKEKR